MRAGTTAERKRERRAIRVQAHCARAPVTCPSRNSGSGSVNPLSINRDPLSDYNRGEGENIAGADRSERAHTAPGLVNHISSCHFSRVRNAVFVPGEKNPIDPYLLSASERKKLAVVNQRAQLGHLSARTRDPLKRAGKRCHLIGPAHRRTLIMLEYRLSRPPCRRRIVIASFLISGRFIALVRC